MTLDIRDALRRPGQSHPLHAALTLPEMDVLDERIAFGRIRLDGQYMGAGESVRVAGRITADVRAHCALCLEPVAAAVEARVDEVFVKDADPDQYPLDGYKIELDKLVKDALLLELPMRFLCAGDCRGLCPVCGINRNLQRCTCQEGSGMDRPLSALSEQ